MLLNTQIKQNKKQGVTLVEVLIVLAIAAVVIAGALVLYGNLQRNSAVNEETTNLSAMFQNIDNFFRRGTTGDLDNAQAIAAGFIPGGMFVNGAIIENAFGGRVEIFGSGTMGIEANDPKAFEVVYTRVPAAACVNFVQGQARVGWDYVSVADSAAAVATGTGGEALAGELFRSSNGAYGQTVRGTTPLSELAIIELCDQNTGTNGFAEIAFAKSST